jgi:hypothetical protein
MAIMTIIIGIAISQKKISDRPWTDHIKSKFIPWMIIVGQIAKKGGKKETNEVTGE